MHTRSKIRLLRFYRIYLAILSLGISLAAVLAQPLSPSLRGFLSAHDPSTMIQCKNRYYIFSTGQGILSKSSADKIFWSPGPSVFTNVPSWTTNAVPGFTGIFWAPDILFFNNQYHLYYAVSTFGSQVSGIGLVTNPTLDPTDPAYHWTDQGLVIQSTNGSPYNTIDPSFIWDTSSNLWMAFGSYWSGIYLVQLNPTTGLRISPASPTYQLAYNSSIEASYVYHHGSYYYLFVNWGSCCSGVNSTYNIRVGRSATVTGPYLDRNGVNMVGGGGSLFLRGTGKFTGPGHMGIISTNGQEFFTYHYYDANAWAPEYGAYGHANFDFEPLSWSTDNWPVFTNNWSAAYRFEADAEDDNHQYFGLLQGGASITNDPVHGHILDLNGTSNYVWLPPGVGYAQTVAAVVNWRGGGAWQRIFDFGFDTTRTFMLTAASGDNVLRCDLNPGGNLQMLQWNKPLPTNTWTHVAVTLDGSRGILYVNGAPVVTNSTMNILPGDVRMQTNHLGRSKFIADPYFNGQYASFRVYGRALSPAEIVAPMPHISRPRFDASWSPGAPIDFAGDATDFADLPLGASNLTWQIQYSDSTATNTVFGPISGVSSGTYLVPANFSGTGIFNVILTAIDSSNRQATASDSLSLTNGSASRASFYPFTTGAQDASNHFNGALVNGASIQIDPTQGSVLNLSGASQYDNLPAGVGNLQTFSAWVKWRGGNSWQRILDFGRDTLHWFFLTPKDAGGLLQCAITPDNSTYNQVIESPSAFPLNTWTHVALVLDGRQGIFYLNGNAVAVNNSVNLLPSDIAANKCYFGRSQFSADPYLNAQLDSIALNSSALSSSEIKQAFLQPTLSANAAGNTFTLSWPAWAFTMRLYTATNPNPPAFWIPVTNPLVSSNNTISVTLSNSSPSSFYRLQWP
jgi:arabinan endo-1,5-alpha-L-arabinosidase